MKAVLFLGPLPHLKAALFLLSGPFLPHEKAALGKLKKVTGFFARGIPNGAELRQQVYHSHDVRSAYDAVNRWFDEMAASDIEDGFTQVYAEPEGRYKETDSRRFDRTEHVIPPPPTQP